jgi:hypothetical protein
MCWAASRSGALPETASAASLPAIFGGRLTFAALRGEDFGRVTNQDNTESFVQEVDQRVREEQLIQAAKRYGPWVGGLIVLVLIAVGGWQIWNDQQLRSQRAEAQAFAAVQQMAVQGNLDGAKAAFERLTARGSNAYRVMARMEIAAILETQGDLEGAVHNFDLAAAAAADPVMKESAQLRAAYIAAETQDFEALQARLQPLLQSHSRVSYLARELLAIQAWRMGHTQLARDTAEDITLAFDAPEGVRQRAQIILSLVGRAPPAAGAAAQSTSTHGASNTPQAAQGESR